MGITILATIFVFSLIVFIHELGHFATAKWAGMQVDEFAIGFGPKLYSTRRGDTEYSLRVIPLGGFNRIAGMSEEEPLNEKSFLNKSVPARLVVIAAGGIMNFVLAIVLFWGLFFAIGTVTVSPEAVVGSTISGSPAEHSALPKGTASFASAIKTFPSGVIFLKPWLLTAMPSSPFKSNGTVSVRMSK